MAADIVAAAVCAAAGFVIMLCFTILCRQSVRKEVEKVTSGGSDAKINGKIASIKAHPARHKILRAIKIAFGMLFYAALLIAVILCVLVSLSVHTRGKLGMPVSALVVASGSMSYVNPLNEHAENISSAVGGFGENSVIFLEKVGQSELNLYDVIAYVAPGDIIIIHRIVGIVPSEDGEVKYITQGDANLSQDALAVSYSDVIGRYNGFEIAGAGAFVMFLRSYTGIVTAVMVIYALSVCEWASGRINRAEKSRKQELIRSFEES